MSSAFFLDGTYKVCHLCWRLVEITIRCKFENSFSLSSDKVVDSLLSNVVNSQCLLLSVGGRTLKYFGTIIICLSSFTLVWSFMEYSKLTFHPACFAR